MRKRYCITVTIGAGAIAAAVCGALLYMRNKRKTQESGLPEAEALDVLEGKAPAAPEPETPEVQFVNEWIQVLKESAKTFSGLYQGLIRIVEGKAKKPEKVLREWCARTRYRWEGKLPAALCEEWIVPLLEGEMQSELGKWAALLLQAAGAAGITRAKETRLLLDEQNVNDYTEWEGEPLYVGDSVEVMSPAWYQNGKLLEQGNCRKQEEADAEQ